MLSSLLLLEVSISYMLEYIHDIEIPGSPVSVPVSVPPEKRDTPVKTISGLRRPSGVAVTDDGLVIVSEWDGHCIMQLIRQRREKDKVITQQVCVTERDNHRVQVLNSDLTFSRMFGSYGGKHGQFNKPVDVDVDSEGFVYVTDSGNNRVQKFTPDGQFVCSFGEKQFEPGHLQCPVGITVNEDLIYVNDARDYITVYTVQ